MGSEGLFKRKNKGFSLVELSIVLIVIATLIFGIVSAKSLIINSKLVDLASTVKKINIAQTSFVNTYKQMPGDAIIESFGEDFKGNADGYVGDGDPLNDESVLFFTHLYKADLLEDVYEKNKAPASLSEITKEYYPETRFKGVFIAVVGSDFKGLYTRANRLLFFSKYENKNNFTPQIAERYNKKFDDGATSGGKIISINTNVVE